jgi:predicted lipoprotein with Yx(FWY)xxD motif
LNRTKEDEFMTNQLRSRAGGLAVVVGVALFVAACGSSSSNSTSSSTPAAAPAASNTPSSSSAGALTIKSASGADGTYLVGTSGRALYMWVADTGGKSACSGACAKVWPPVISSGTPTVSGGVNSADLSTITRSDGTHQVTYKGHPLYYFVADPSSGTIKGQGSDSFGAKWWLVAPSGAVITKTGGGSSSSSGGSSSGGYSSGGYG